MKINDIHDILKAGYSRGSAIGIIGCLASIGIFSVALVCPIFADYASANAISSEYSSENIYGGVRENMARDIMDGLDDSLGGSGSEDVALYSEDQDASIELYAAGASLSIGTPSLQTVLQPGEIGYLASDVTYNVTDANYTIQVSYANGKTALTNGSANLAGAGTSGVTGSSLADDTWGFAWGATTDTNSNMKYYTMPVYGTKGSGISTGRLENSTMNANSVKKKIVFAAKFADNNTNSGHYTTQVLLSLVATPKYTYTLSYDANNGTGAPAAQTCTTTTDSCSITISSTKPTRTGYVFKGWGENSTTSTVSWAASSSITMTADKTIYAVWEEQVKINGITNMQQMTSDICAASAVGDEATLTDTRDSSTYTVEKLNDGKCWMTQNLRIVNKTITSADSDVSANYTIPASSTSGFSSDTASNAYYGNSTTYGTYYTWCAATAGTCSSITTAGKDAPGSICPKGWRLPKGTPGTGTSEFAVVAGLTSTNIAASTNYWSSLSSPSFASNALTVNGVTWLAAGTYYNGLGAVGGGGYWSSTASSGTSAYSLGFGNNNFRPANSNDRRTGFSVRCVAK